MNDKAYFLGIELGSTRIKAVIIDEARKPVRTAEHGWENALCGGYWTYSLDDVWAGLRDVCGKLAADGSDMLAKVRAMGVSAMMHGYLPFDADGNQLTAFRTWRNTNTERAAAELTEKFSFNFPQRWSIAHLYQAMLDKEEHADSIAFLTTLAGYVHWKLTGEKVLGVGDASGMFPIDADGGYDKTISAGFEKLTGKPGLLERILPKPLMAGQNAGYLSAEGAKLLDPQGHLKPGTALCPPEGDAGTGMAATNSVAPRTGNISAGTSIFAMAVLDKPLKGVYEEIDMVTTPGGLPVAMVHCNNCTSDLDAWVKLMSEAAQAAGAKTLSRGDMYAALYREALSGEADCGGILTYNYLSGEPICKLTEGRPLVTRTPSARLTFPNFARALITSCIATLRIGMDILTERESIKLGVMTGHGGLFKAPLTGQRLMAAALNTTVRLMESAGEGGAWGIALLAAYMIQKSDEESLESYLDGKVFADSEGSSVNPEAADVLGFSAFMDVYKRGMEIERAAVSCLRNKSCN